MARPLAKETAITKTSLRPRLHLDSNMRPLFFALLMPFFPATLLGGGSIVGTVRAEGKPGTEQQTAGGKYDSFKYKFVERINYAELCDFVVYIDGPIGPTPTPPEKPLT